MKTQGRCRLFLAAAFLSSFLCAAGSGMAADATEQGDVKPSVRPKVIYVSDFLLDADQDKGEKGLHGPLQVRRRIKGMVDQLDETPQEKAQKIVTLLAQSIVSELTDKGVNSARIPAKAEPMSGSWLLEG